MLTPVNHVEMYTQLLQKKGYTCDFFADTNTTIKCRSCSATFPASSVTVDELHRYEGQSDPEAMGVLVALSPPDCPEGGCRGVLTLSYGPAASVKDSEVLLQLPEAGEE